MKAWAYEILQSHHFDRFVFIDELYQELYKAQAVWLSINNFSCIPNCGVCCREYYPEITESEGLYAALCILFEHWDNILSVTRNFDELGNNSTSRNIDDVSIALQSVFPNFNDESGGCPFRSNTGPHYCLIYPGRPLVCRLFNAAGERAKDGSIRYSPCKIIKKQQKLAFSNTDSKLVVQKITTGIPVMSDYAYRLHGNERNEKIKPIIIEMIKKILFTLHLRGDRPHDFKRVA